VADYQTIETGDTSERGFTLVAKASGSPITSGTVNYYLKAKSGANAGKWWRDSDQTWQAVEIANAMTHDADGHWSRTLAASPFSDGVIYLEYAKESGDIHVPVSRRLKAGYTPSADSNRRADLGKWLGVAPNALQTGRPDVYVGANNDKTGYALAASERVKLAASQPDYAPLLANNYTAPPDAAALQTAAEAALAAYAAATGQEVSAAAADILIGVGTPLQADDARLDTITGAAEELAPLIEGGAFTEAALANSPGAAGSDPETIRNTVWGNSSGVRNLTNPSSSVDAEPAVGTIALRQGDRWTHSITGLGPLAGRVRLYFTLKTSPTINDDSAALIQIEEADGLLCLQGSQITGVDQAQGSITVDDEGAGNITLSLWPAATALLTPSRPNAIMYYDVKIVRTANTDAATLDAGTGTITSAVTRAVS
jgi:hypothetical protein